MGCTYSNDINVSMDIKRKHDEEKVKYILLGAGESGKSTIFKQMRILYGPPMTDESLRIFGVVIRANIKAVVVQLCQLIRMLEVEDDLDAGYDAGETINNKVVEDILTPSKAFKGLILYFAIDKFEPRQPDVELSNDWVGYCPGAGLYPNIDAQITLELWKQFKVLWKSKAMKYIWQKRALVNIVDGHKAFLDDIDRIVSPTFKPTYQDVLHARIKTTNVIVERYKVNKTQFEMYDVGGQRAQRRKWINYFDNVNGVIFVAALSEYDQTLCESKKTNRMVETLELFRSVCMNKAFVKKPIILFLNKIDIFEEKLQYSDIAEQEAFSDFAGPPNNLPLAISYFVQKFKDCLVQDNLKEDYIKACTATDTRNIQFVMHTTQNIILRDNLLYSGVI